MGMCSGRLSEDRGVRGSWEEEGVRGREEEGV